MGHVHSLLRLLAGRQTEDVTVTFTNGITDISVDYVQPQAASGAGVPKGAVMLFNLAACPEGWIELTAARGRAVVGLPAGGLVAGTRGTGVADRANIASHSHTYDQVIAHTHSIYEPGHYHQIWSKDDDFNCTGDGQGHFGIRACPDNGSYTWPTTNAYAVGAFTGISGTNPTGSASATTYASGDVPYIQLLMCQKD